MAAKDLGISKDDWGNLFFLKSWENPTSAVVEAGFQQDTEDYLGWPEKFERRLEKHKPGTKAYAQVAVNRLEHYKKTGE